MCWILTLLRLSFPPLPGDAGDIGVDVPLADLRYIDPNSIVQRAVAVSAPPSAILQSSSSVEAPGGAAAGSGTVTVPATASPSVFVPLSLHIGDSATLAPEGTPVRIHGVHPAESGNELDTTYTVADLRTGTQPKSNTQASW